MTDLITAILPSLSRETSDALTTCNASPNSEWQDKTGEVSLCVCSLVHRHNGHRRTMLFALSRIPFLRRGP